jgi:[protein-PII] uridylyltransferase
MNCADLTSQTEALLLRVLGSNIERNVSVCAMGSFARREMCPGSDVDLLLLVDEEYDDFHGALAELVRSIQESIPRAAMTVRSLEQCCRVYNEDVRSWLAVLESRPLLDDSARHVRLRDLLQQQVRDEGLDWCNRRLAAYAVDRHAQYGDALRMLEPNIKNSAGSLRDIHALHHQAFLIEMMEVGESPFPDFEHAVNYLPLSDQRREECRRAFAFMLHVRWSMHHLTGHLQDTLHFDLQRDVAAVLGYGEQHDRSAVERFMSEYYANAKSVRQAHTIVFQKANPKGKEGKPEPVGTTFLVNNGVLTSVKNKALTFQDALAACRYRSRYSCEYDPFIVELLDRIQDGKEISQTGAEPEFLDDILRTEQYAGSILRELNEWNLLGFVLPEFQPLISYFQHNIYHHYTLDEHTISAMECSDTWVGESSLRSVLMAENRDPSLLRYAILFHDIAKPVDRSRHEMEGERMARTLLARAHREDIAEDVAFLVRHHLMLEQVAFRRNYRDASTLEALIHVVGSEDRLRLLYLLTVADMSALNPRVWSPWKDEILTELFLLARDYLASRRSDFIARPSPPREGPHSEPAVVRHGRPDDGTERPIAGVLDIRFECQETVTRVRVRGNDEPFFLSRIAAVLLAADARILNADIATEEQRTASDVFTVVSILDDGPLSVEQEEAVRRCAITVWNGTTDTEELFVRHRRKWKRKARKAGNQHATVAVQFHEHVTDGGKEQTIVDVFAPDAYGLLYRLARALSRCNLMIHHARIATRVDGIVDTFYVTSIDGLPVSDARDQQRLRDILESEVRATVTEG